MPAFLYSRTKRIAARLRPMSKVRAEVCEARDGVALSNGEQSAYRSMATWAFTPSGANPNKANCGETSPNEQSEGLAVRCAMAAATSRCRARRP